MQTLTTRIISDPLELRSAAEEWDDLWLRSSVAAPTLRASLVADHLQHFAPEARLWCPLVEDECGRVLAALPLVEHRMSLLTCGGLPNNDWSSAGDLLIDESADVDAVCDALVEALAQAPWPLLWLDLVPYGAARWQSLFEALARAGGQWETKPSFEVARISTTGSWEEYQASWSRNHCRHMKRYRKRLEEAGDVRFESLDDLAAGEVEGPLAEVFEVENRNWKGEGGTSVLQTPGLWDFYFAQARRLADRGQLRLHFLRLGQQPIAVEYGFTAKGVYHPCKIGYDSGYQKQSPGNVLLVSVLKQCFGDPEVEAVDFMGPLTPSCAHWQPQRYSVGRVMLALPTSLVGQAMLGAYRHVWPAVKRLGRGGKALVESTG